MAARHLRVLPLTTLTCKATVEEALELMARQGQTALIISCPDHSAQCRLTREQIMIRVAECGCAPDQMSLAQVFEYAYEDEVPRACRTWNSRGGLSAVEPID
jgi:hypothetical protein